MRVKKKERECNNLPKFDMTLQLWRRRPVFNITSETNRPDADISYEIEIGCYASLCAKQVKIDMVARYDTSEIIKFI